MIKKKVINLCGCLSLQDFNVQSQWSGSGCSKQVLWICPWPRVAVLLLLLQTPLPIFLHVRSWVWALHTIFVAVLPKHLVSDFISFNRKTSDVPEQYREEGELVVPSYGYFIRGAQTTFSGVLRFVGEKNLKMHAQIWLTDQNDLLIYEIFDILFQRPTMEVHPVQNDRFWLWIWNFIDKKQPFPPAIYICFWKYSYSNI